MTDTEETETHDCAHCHRPLTSADRALGYCDACLEAWIPWGHEDEIYMALKRWWPGPFLEDDPPTRVSMTIEPGEAFHARWSGLLAAMVLLPIIHDVATHQTDRAEYRRLEAAHGHGWAFCALNAFQLPAHWRCHSMVEGKLCAVPYVRVFSPGRRGYLTGYPEPLPSEDVWRVERRSNEGPLSPAEQRAWGGLRLNAPKHTGLERLWKTSEECRTAVLVAINALRAEGVREPNITLERVADRVGYSHDRFKALLHDFGFTLMKLKRGLQ